MKFKTAALAAIGIAVFSFTFGPVIAQACEPTPPAPSVTLGYSTSCGVITLTTVNNESVPAGWYYGLKGSVGDERVVSAVQKGPGTMTKSYTFAEDSYGGTVDVDVTVYAATEQDLLPTAWPYGTVEHVKVITDCKANPVAATMNLTYMTGCSVDPTNTWRIRNGSTFPVPYTLEYAGQGVKASGIAPVGDTLVDLPRIDATAILKWGGGDSGIIAGQATKASGVDEVSATCAGDKPADKVVTKDVGTPDCGATTIKTETTTVTYVREGNSWIAQTPVITNGVRTLTNEEKVLFQNTNPDGKCYVAPPTKDATTVVTTDKWNCNDKTAVTHTVTTTYSFVFDTKTGKYGDAVPNVGAPVAGTRVLTDAEFKPCEVTPTATPTAATSHPVASQQVSESVVALRSGVLADTGANVPAWMALIAAGVIVIGSIIIAVAQRKKM